MSFASICCPLTPLADSSLSSFATGICDVYRLAAVCSSVLPFGAPNWQEIGKVFDPKDPKAGRLLPTTASKVFLVRPLRTIYLEKLFTCRWRRKGGSFRREKRDQWCGYAMDSGSMLK